MVTLQTHMSTEWQETTFRSRMRRFENSRPPRVGEVSVSIKVRVSSGCFHREHSAEAYALIDEELRRFPADTALEFEEHESGPEVLVYVAAGLALTKSVIDLITAIIKARSDGIAKGDRHTGQVELIVRRAADGEKYKEEVVLRLDPGDRVSEATVRKCLGEALERTIRTDGPKQLAKPEAVPSPTSKRRRRRQS